MHWVKCMGVCVRARARVCLCVYVRSVCVCVCMCACVREEHSPNITTLDRYRRGWMIIFQLRSLVPTPNCSVRRKTKLQYRVGANRRYLQHRTVSDRPGQISTVPPYGIVRVCTAAAAATTTTPTTINVFGSTTPYSICHYTWTRIRRAVHG